MRVYIDTEFSDLSEQNELISIGCISEDGKRFYAENSCYRVEHCSEFVVETVLPLLEGGNHLMHYSMIAKNLRLYIESFDGLVKMYSDACYWDWQHVEHLFETYGWPENLVRSPVALTFPSSIQQTRFTAAVEDAFKLFKPTLRRHHALDDAVANKFAFERATTRRF
jgi:hypothetical protein